MENTHTQKVEGGQKILPSLLEKKYLKEQTEAAEVKRGKDQGWSRWDQKDWTRLASRGHFACPLEIYPSKGEKIT